MMTYKKWYLTYGIYFLIEYKSPFGKKNFPRYWLQDETAKRMCMISVRIECMTPFSEKKYIDIDFEFIYLWSVNDIR